MMDSPKGCHTAFVSQPYCTSSRPKRGAERKKRRRKKLCCNIHLSDHLPLHDGWVTVFTSLAIPTNVGSRCKNALNFSSASFCVDARYKLEKINYWIRLRKIATVICSKCEAYGSGLPVCCIQIIGTRSIQNDFELNFSIFGNCTKSRTIQHHTLITM